MSKEATGRYDTCAEFIQALEETLLPNQGTAHLPVVGQPQVVESNGAQIAPKRSGKLMRTPIVLGIGLGLALSVAAYFYARSHRVAVAPPAAVAVAPASPRIEPPAEAKLAAKKPEPKQKSVEMKTVPAPAVKAPAVAPIVDAPRPVQTPDPGPDQPAISYMGSPEGRFAWSGTLGAGEQLVIVRNRVRMGSISGNGLPAGVGVQVETRPADIRVMQQPAASNGFRLIIVNQSGREATGFTVLWREQAR